MSKKNKNALIIGVVAVFAAVLAVLVFVFADRSGGDDPLDSESTGTTATEETKTPPADKAYLPLELEDGLLITDIENYTGAYMEDGTNEVVSDVLMVILENKSGKDLQYATITLPYESFNAEFAVTNLPSGGRAVLLDKNRAKYTAEKPSEAVVANVVFQEKFNLGEDVFKIDGEEKMIKIKNISDGDITGDIYVYYKNSSQDLFYGGITYRVKISGLGAGADAEVYAGHYNPKSSTIVMVSYPS